jgi:hypothetical protein
MAGRDKPTRDLVGPLRSVEPPLATLVALEIADRTVDNRRRKKVSLDRLLVDPGLPTARVAGLPGKTQRAVQLAVADETLKKPT